MSAAIGNGRFNLKATPLTPMPTWQEFCQDWIRENGDPGPGLPGLEIINAAWMKKYPLQKARGMSGFYKARQDMGLSRKLKKKRTNASAKNTSVENVENLLSHAELIGEFFDKFDNGEFDLITRVFNEFTVKQMKELEILCSRLKTTKTRKREGAQK